MESAIIDINTDSLPKMWPRIARTKGTALIVLFHADGKGTVLHSGSGVHSIGYYATDWLPLDREDIWEIIPNITMNFKL